jgi:hypothetical protein
MQYWRSRRTDLTTEQLLAVPLLFSIKVELGFVYISSHCLVILSLLRNWLQLTSWTTHEAIVTIGSYSNLITHFSRRNTHFRYTATCGILPPWFPLTCCGVAEIHIDMSLIVQTLRLSHSIYDSPHVACRYALDGHISNPPPALPTSFPLHQPLHTIATSWLPYTDLPMY